MMSVWLLLTDTLMICVPPMLTVILTFALLESVLEKLLELLAIETANVWQDITAMKAALPTDVLLNLVKMEFANTTDNAEFLSLVVILENVFYHSLLLMELCVREILLNVSLLLSAEEETVLPLEFVLLDQLPLCLAT